MADPVMNVTLRGDGLYPDTLDVLDLLRVLGHLREAIRAQGDLKEVKTQQGAREAILSIATVKEGSAILGISVPVSLRGIAGRIIECIREQRYFGLNAEAWAQLHELSKVIAKYRWTLTWSIGDSADATISEETPIPIPAARRATGTTTIYGKLDRIGGTDSPTAWIWLDSGKRLTVNLTQEQARQLSPRLYDTIGLEGEAVWETVSWEILEFRASRVLAYHRTGVADAFAQLTVAANGALDGVDVNAFIREIRGMDEEDEG